MWNISVFYFILMLFNKKLTKVVGKSQTRPFLWHEKKHGKKPSFSCPLRRSLVRTSGTPLISPLFFTLAKSRNEPFWNLLFWISFTFHFPRNFSYRFVSHSFQKLWNLSTNKTLFKLLFNFFENMGSHGMSGAEYLASIYGTEKDKVSDFRDVRPPTL